jgi:hypothetical protein
MERRLIEPAGWNAGWRKKNRTGSSREIRGRAAQDFQSLLIVLLTGVRAIVQSSEKG